jgi:hypothetical protein
MAIARKLVKFISNPAYGFKLLFRHLPGVPVGLRVEFDALDVPPYSYGMYKAALQARALNIPEISVIEFGVAGGNGLLAMERIANTLEQKCGVRFQIYGFDIREGLPEALDCRDLPYAWKKGAYKMDEEALRRRLSRSTLVLGDVKDTTPHFLDDEAVPPIGFISFDLDYYSSTAHAFKIFDREPARYLPRVMCYFDDTLGHDDEYHFEQVGELLAIKEFNETHQDIKIGAINGFGYKRVFPDKWNVGTYVCHFFNSPLYNTYISRLPEELPLRE